MLLSLLPKRHQKCAETKKVQEAISKEFNELVNSYDNMLLQLFVSTATEEGLSIWEKMYGLIPDSIDVDYRRSRIMSKMRGSGTTTAQMIKKVCEAFYGGKVEIIENFNDYSFDVVFKDSIGTPPNLNDMTAAIEEIKPAHLAFQYVITYLRYSEVANYTHFQLSAYNYSKIKEGGL